MRSAYGTKNPSKRWLTILTVFLLLFAGCQTAQEGAEEEPTVGTTSPSPTATGTVLVGDSSHGKILTDSEGRTLYLFMNDTQGESTCYDQCATRWLALTVTGQAQAGEGVDGSLLATTQRRDGTMQVTYNGHPLYHFSGDQAPGQTNGQGVGDVWFVVSPQGDAIR